MLKLRPDKSYKCIAFSEVLLFVASAHQMLEGIVDNMKHDFLSMEVSVPVVRSEM